MFEIKLVLKNTVCEPRTLDEVSGFLCCRKREVELLDAKN